MNRLDMLNYELLGNSIVTWLASVAVFALVWTGLAIARRVIRKRLTGHSNVTAPTALQIARHVVSHTTAWFLVLVALYAGTRMLAASAWTSGLIPRAVVAGLVIQLGLWATAALSMFLTMRRARQLAEDPSTVAAMDLLGFVLRVIVWSAVLLVLLDNVGVNITTLIAGLGVGGIAVALAAQNILGDLFASLSIVLDKPFGVGDSIVIDGFTGSVEHVGLKTTRLRSLSGEQVIFSNADLLTSRIRNYGRMFERRVVFSFGVTYETAAGKVRRIPTMVREIVEGHDRVRFDRAHFQSLGDSALQFEVVYYVLTPAYNVYMDTQQSINLALLEQFAAESIDFAYPTRTLRIVSAQP